MEQSQIWSTTYTVKSGWTAGRKILKIVKKYGAFSAFRTAFNEVVFTVREDDIKKQEIYKHLLQMAPKKYT